MLFYQQKNFKISNENVGNINPTSGICIFIDICGSTEVKNNELPKWLTLLHNTMVSMTNSAIFQDNIVKVIGDEIMIFIKDSDLGSVTYDTVLLELMNSLEKFPNQLSEWILETKASIHYCKDVYEISFINPNKDFYGIGIDLTARLIGKASNNTIIVSDDYYRKINPGLFNGLSITTTCTEKLKGISTDITFHEIKVS